jgi:hypothetical protein
MPRAAAGQQALGYVRTELFVTPIEKDILLW